VRLIIRNRRHKNIKNTLLYGQFEEALSQGYQERVSKVAETEKEICCPVEAGFEYVTDFEGALHKLKM